MGIATRKTSAAMTGAWTPWSGPFKRELKIRNTSQTKTHNYFATTAAAISPCKVDGMWGRPCLWDKEKEKGSKGGNDGMRAC